ncbi:MAG: hypothetical protein AB8B88_10395, partial [Devosiaceae bacterium]
LGKAEETASGVTQTLQDLRKALESSLTATPETRQRRVMETQTINAQVGGTAEIGADSPLSGILAGGQNGALSVTVADTSAELSIDAATNREALVSSFNAIGGLSASFDANNRLQLTATNGERLEVRNNSSTSLADLGLATNATETLSREVQVIDNAAVTGTKDLRPFENEQAYALTSADAGLSVTVGSNDTVTLTRRDVASLSQFVTALDGIGGLNAGLDDQGRLQLEATGGQTLDVRTTNNEMLDVLGLTATGTETKDFTRTIQDNAQLTGTTNIRDVANLEALAGTQDGASFDIQLGSAGAATRISITSTTTGQDLLDDLNAVANVSATFTGEGALRVEASDGSTIAITDISRSLTNDLGITENGTQIITTADTNAAYQDSLTGTVNISSGKLEDIAGVEQDAQFSIQVEGAAQATSITINRNDRSSDLLAQLNAVANISASLNGDGTLLISTDNGTGFFVTEETGLSLEGLGIVENIRNPSTIDAQITGAIDLGTGRLRDLMGIGSGDALSVTVNGVSSTVTVSSNTRADGLASSLSNINGVSASVNASGQLVVTGEDGNRIELRNETGDLLQGLGISLNDSEDVPTAGYSITAETTGTVALGRNDRLRTIDGAFATGNLQIDVTQDVGGSPVTTPNTIVIDENSRVRNLVDQINAVAGISASLNADDQLEIVANNDSISFELTNLVSDVLSPLGLSEGTFAPIVVPPGTEPIAYASADATVGPETRTVRVGSAQADVTSRQEDYTEDWAIVEQSATQRTETEFYQNDFVRADSSIFYSFRTETETIAEDEDTFNPVLEWETARSSIENSISLAVSSGTVVLTGTSVSLADREGSASSTSIRGQNMSIGSLGLENLQSTLENGDIESAIKQLDAAILKSSYIEQQFSTSGTRVDLDLALASSWKERLSDERSSLFASATPQNTSGQVANSLAGLQLAMAGNRTDQLRSFV